MLPSNPTGTSLTKSQLTKIAKLAKEHDLWVIADEIYGQLLFEGEFISIASLPGMKKRSIVFNGVSKSHAMTGWRVGFLCAPEPVVSRCTKIHQYSAMCVSTVSQYASIEALKNGDKEVAKMRESYLKRANLFVEDMQNCGLETVFPDGGFYCFPSIKSTGLSSLEFAKQLVDEKKVAVVPGTAFGDEEKVMLGVAFATELSDLMKASKRIQEFVSGLM